MKKIIILAIIGYILMQNEGIKEKIMPIIHKYTKDFLKTIENTTSDIANSVNDDGKDK